MKRYSHLKEKATKWREEGKSLTYICERLSLNKSTVHYWIKGIKYERDKQTYGQQRGTQAMVRKYKTLRKEAYDKAFEEAPALLKNNYFRDFILLYMTEGFRRTGHSVNLANSNPAIVRTFNDWLIKLTEKDIKYILRIHDDHDVKAAVSYWSKYLGIGKKKIKVNLKNNTSRMKTRNWRNLHGILTVQCCDTYLRSAIEAYMDTVEKSWDNLRNGQ